MSGTLTQKAVDVLQSKGYYLPDSSVSGDVVIDSGLNTINKSLFGTEGPQSGQYSIDWRDTQPGGVDYYTLTSRWDTKFSCGQRGVMVYKIKRSGVATALAHVPLHSWVSDVTGPLTRNEVKNQVVHKLRSQGVEFWREPELDGDNIVIYFVTGIGPALVALAAIGIFGIGLLINWTVDTVTVSRIKRDYAREAIEAGQQIDDPQERAEFFATQAEAIKSESLVDFGLGDFGADLSGGLKAAVIAIGVAAAVAVVILVVSRS